MRPYISDDLCEQCGECVTICPYEVFGEEEGRVKVVIPEECIECTDCIRSCPHKAIRMDD